MEASRWEAAPQEAGHGSAEIHLGTGRVRPLLCSLARKSPCRQTHDCSVPHKPLSCCRRFGLARVSPLLSGVLAVEEGTVGLTVAPAGMVAPAESYHLRIAPLRCTAVPLWTASA